MTKEDINADRIGLDTVKKYFRALGGWPFAFRLFGTLFVERCFYLSTDLWLAVWTDASDGPPKMSGSLPQADSRNDTRMYLGVYVAFACFSAILAFARVHVFASGCVSAAQSLFDKLVVSLLGAPMWFFETTPLGRISNRISFDTEVIDGLLLQRVNGVVASFAWTMGGVVVMVFTIPFMALVLLPILVIYAFLYAYYRRSCVDLQLIEAKTKSPMQIHLIESQIGGECVRSFGLLDEFDRAFVVKVEKNQRSAFVLTGSNRWLSIRLDLMAAVVVTSAALFATLLEINGSLAALAILWATNFVVSLNFSTVNLTESESKLTSVQRVAVYSECPEEPTSEDSVVPGGGGCGGATALEGKRNDDDDDGRDDRASLARVVATTAGVARNRSWPTSGEIRFRDAWLNYRDELPPALRGLTLTIRNGERVGICGRTGSGKSTIATSLFRLRPLMKGKIGVGTDDDISVLPYGVVRGGRMLVVSQEALVFSGPLRKTLDPFDEQTDRSIWSAVRMLEMDATILRMSSSSTTTAEKDVSDTDVARALRLPVQDGGSNFSVGERQLLCFIRAVLQKPKILILDEATASCDAHTDATIQRAIRKHFQGTTMLIIAHRLNTIMDCDKILVMEQGQAVEFASPGELLRNPDSLFSGLVASTGKENAAELRRSAISVAGDGEAE
eukprot:g4042.t1